MSDRRKSPFKSLIGLDPKWLTLAVVGAGTFMSALDGSVVNTALPIIGKATGATVSGLEWVVLVYLLTVSSSLLSFGRLSDIYGQRGLYVAGLGVFSLGSLMCGFATSVEMLVGFRAFQALGAAMLFALGPAVLTGAFPRHERGRALGMQATVTYLGLATGPALGGILTQHFGWQSIFFINVPIGAIVIAAAVKSIKSNIIPTHQPFDPIGAVTLAVTLFSLIYAVSKGNDFGWNSTIIVALLVIALLSFIVFVVVEHRSKHPLLDLKLFSNVTFSASTLAAFLNYMATSSLAFLMPFYLIHARNFTPSVAGLILISTPATMALLAGPSGFISDKIGVRIPATLGMAITAAGLLSLRMLNASSTPLQIVPHLILIGIGVGIFTSPNNSAIMGSAPLNRQGVAGAILAAARNIGFAVGIAVAGLIYTAKSNELASYMQTVPNVITGSMQSATTVIAIIASMGIVISAFRGQVAPKHH